MATWTCKYGDGLCNPLFGLCKYCERELDLEHQERRLVLQRRSLEVDYADEVRRDRATGEALAAAGGFIAEHPVATGLGLLGAIGLSALVQHSNRKTPAKKPAPMRMARSIGRKK